MKLTINLDNTSMLNTNTTILLFKFSILNVNNNKKIKRLIFNTKAYITSYKTKLGVSFELRYLLCNR